MNRTIAALFGVGLLTGGVPDIAHADDAVSRTIELDAFSRIETQGSFELYVEVGGDQSIEIEAEERDQKRISAEIEGDTLVISYRERFFSFLDRRDRIIRINAPTLDGVEINGSVHGEISGIEASSFDVDANGMSEITLSGNCDRLEIDLNGMGNLNAKDLECRDVSVEINGMGDVTVFASQSITARMNGMGDVDVYGNPSEVSPRIDGFGDFSIKE